MATSQLRRPDERAKGEIASAQPRETFYSSNARDARSVTVDFSITGPAEAVRYFLSAVVHTRSLEALRFFVEHYGPSLQSFTATVGGEYVRDMGQIAATIERKLR